MEVSHQNKILRSIVRNKESVVGASKNHSSASPVYQFKVKGMPSLLSGHSSREPSADISRCSLRRESPALIYITQKVDIEDLSIVSSSFVSEAVSKSQTIHTVVTNNRSQKTVIGSQNTSIVNPNLKTSLKSVDWAALLSNKDKSLKFTDFNTEKIRGTPGSPLTSRQGSPLTSRSPSPRSCFKTPRTLDKKDRRVSFSRNCLVKLYCTNG